MTEIPPTDIAEILRLSGSLGIDSEPPNPLAWKAYKEIKRLRVMLQQAHQRGESFMDLASKRYVEIDEKEARIAELETELLTVPPVPVDILNTLANKAEETMKKFKVGNIVYLNYSAPATHPPPHPAMVVTNVYVRPDDKDDDVECGWFYEGIYYHERFPMGALQLKHGSDQ